MILQKLAKTVMTLSFLAGAVAQADPGRYPGPDYGRGGGGRPGPVRPGPDDNECRERTRGGRYYDPRCDDYRRGDRDRDRGHRYPPHRPPPRHYPPYNPPRNPPPVYNPPPSHGASSVDFYAVTRRGGGEWLRINLHNPIRVDYVQVQILHAAMQIHDAVAITRSGARYSIRNLSRTGVFYSSVSSEYLSIYEDIIAIDLRAESMGDHANIRVTVSGNGYTSLTGSRY